jgi:aminoglycoside phosphotransferase
MLDLPDKIKSLIHEEEYSIDDVGMSDSTVVLFKDKVLKIQTISEEAENEYHVMEWLQGKLPVPKVLGYERDEKKAYLLMTKVPGEMACADKYLKDPEQLTTMLAEGLQMLWNVDINHCPCIWNLEKKLQMAKYRVENNLVDVDDAEPGTFGENGFKNPNHLLEWLNNHKPEEDLVLSHGDFCLPNIFLANGKVSGYIDLGRAGIADKWQDIALCYRSLLHNLNGKYTGKQYQRFYADMLFEKLGLEPNWDKIRYYILLDELF